MIEIPLTRGFVAIIDDEDLPLVSRFKWHAQVSRYKRRATDRVYAKTKIRNTHPEARFKWTNLPMHRLLLGLGFRDPLMVDHIDHDGLNNTQANIRAVTALGNAANRRPHRQKVR